MRNPIVILILLVGNNVSNGQTTIDSISISRIAEVKTLEDTGYQIPEPLSVNHFLIVCKRSKIDPLVSYNPGNTLSDKSLTLLSKLKTGDIIELKEIYGTKPGSINQSKILFPDRAFIVH